ncbi:MAG: protein kinase [Acidobacteriota bacterium]
MNPQRWLRIEELFHAAESLPSAERPAYLLEACAGDEDLRREVDSLLREAVSDDGHLAGPALLAGGGLVAAFGPAIAAGQSIGPYHVQSLLGSGGMGEVYRARDTKLGRDVAIKILPAAFVHHPDRRARLEREARMLASLHHPGICGIYGIEEVNGILLLVLELVSGATLADTLQGGAERGGRGLPLEHVMTITRQIAEAVELAHDKGIIHRDLKPANIKITPEGIVKILDFGLAKVVTGDGAEPNLTLAPATSDGERTGPVMGTAAYMSPEQARGLPVDKRTDIWALGCIVYEMLTGSAVFAGDTASDSIAKILEREPNWSILPESLSPSLRRLLFRSLVKDPKKRLRDIGEFRFEVDALLDDPASGVPDGSGAPVGALTRRLPWAAVAALVTAVAAVAALAAWSLSPAPAIAPVRFAHILPPGQILNGSRGAHIVAVSPDGSQFVYSGAPHGLYRRLISEWDAAIIPGTEAIEVSEPVFSPDGQSIAFFTIADGSIEQINLSGGAPQLVTRVKAIPTGIRWEPQGIIYGQGVDGIMRVAAKGGTPEVLVRVKEGETAYNPQTLPDGDHVLFTLATGEDPSRWDLAQIVVESIRTRNRKQIIDGGSDARYLTSGYLLYALAGTMYAAAFDVKTLELTGQQVPVVEGVRRASGSFTGAAALSLSTNGTLAYVPGPPAGERSAPLDFGLMNRQGEIKPLGLPGGPYARPRASPDGKRIAFERADGRQAVVFTYELSGTQTMQPLATVGNNRFPTWVYRGVAYQSDRDGDRAIWWQELDGAARRLTKPEPGTSHAPESSFGEYLLYSARKGSDVSLWTYSFRTGVSTRFDAVPSSANTDAMFAPDGRSIAYSTTTGNQMTLYVQGFPTGAPHAFAARAADTPKQARWSPDGKELCYDPNVYRFECVRITAEPFAFGTAVSLPKKLQGAPPGERADYDITPDGRFLGLITAGRTEFIRGSDNRINIVLNWFQELRARVRHR